MRIEHELNYVSDKVECFKITNSTYEEYEKISKEYKVLDAWLKENSKETFESQIGEFDYYLILDSKNSMLFKLAYSTDK